VVHKMAVDVDAVLSKQEVKAALNQNGVEPAPLKTKEFAQSVQEISAQWASVIKSSNARVD
jgi:tripartite-type tricarboxylate transporter receptor subunit TctC